MQAPYVLRQSSFPGNWHREEQRVETGVIEAFSNMPTRRKDQALIVTATFKPVLALLRSFTDIQPLS